MSISYFSNRFGSREDIVGLYSAVGWSAYTNEPARIEAAVASSLFVVTAWEADTLVGLARIVGDGLTIAYLQDILVAPTHQRLGIGKELFSRAFAPFEDVRQKVLLTDDEPQQRAFYESMGFTELRDLKHPTRSFVKFG